MKIIRRLLRYATPLHHYVPEYMIYTLLGILFGLINFTMLIPMLNIMFGVAKTEPVQHLPSFSLSVDYFISLFNYYFTNIIAANGRMYALGFICTIILVATILSNLFRYLAIKVLIRLRLNTMERIRNDLYSKLTHQSLRFYSHHKKGNILSTMTNEVQEIESTFINALQSFLRDPFIIIVYFIGLFYISPRLTLFTLVLLPISALLITAITKKLRRLSYFSVEQLGNILSHTEETISGIRVIQSFAAENYSVERFRKINRDFSRNSRSLFSRKEFTSPVSELLVILIVVAIVMYGGYLLTTRQSDLTGSLLRKSCFGTLPFFSCI